MNHAVFGTTQIPRRGALAAFMDFMDFMDFMAAGIAKQGAEMLSGKSEV